MGGRAAGGDHAGRVNVGVGAGRRRRRRRPGHRPATRAEMRAQSLRHRATYILVFNSSGQLFVHRRTATKDIYPSYYDVAVGGVVGAGESYDDGAQRELAEELGITAVPPRPILKFQYEDLEQPRQRPGLQLLVRRAARASGGGDRRRRVARPRRRDRARSQAARSAPTASRRCCATSIVWRASARSDGSLGTRRPCSRPGVLITDRTESTDRTALAWGHAIRALRVIRGQCSYLHPLRLQRPQRLVDDAAPLCRDPEPGRRSSTPCTLAASSFEISTGKNP